jgi:putative transposase
MTNYRRTYIPGSTWFFTVNLAERRDNHLLVEKIELLKAAFRDVKERKPYRINALVIMLGHRHAIKTLPEGDDDFDWHWRQINLAFQGDRNRRAAYRQSVWEI